MNKIVITFLLLAGCSSAPVIDYKASENPKETIGDTMECEWLTAKAFTFFPWDEAEVFKNCLAGRGYSVINR